MNFECDIKLICIKSENICITPGVNRDGLVESFERRGDENASRIDFDSLFLLPSPLLEDSISCRFGFFHRSEAIDENDLFLIELIYFINYF